MGGPAVGVCPQAACGPARTGIAAPGAAADNVLSNAFIRFFTDLRLATPQATLVDPPCRGD